MNAPSTPTIGILAGMGPRSTAPFIDLVVTECQNQYGARDDIDFPKMLICSQPAPFYEDRPVDHAALEAAILDGLHTLENAGASFLAMACNTELSLPPQHIVELSNRQLAKAPTPDLSGKHRPQGMLEWPALRRMLDRRDPSYRS